MMRLRIHGPSSSGSTQSVTTDTALGVEFLAEARQRLAGAADDLFDEATEHYLVSRDKLKAVSEMHPFKCPSADDDERLCDADVAAILREVAGAEEKGLATLGKLVEVL